MSSNGAEGGTGAVLLDFLIALLGFLSCSSYVTNLRAGSKMQLFSMGGDKLLFQVEDSVKDLSVTSTLVPSTSKISTVTGHPTVTTDTSSGTSNSYPSETIEVNGTPYVTRVALKKSNNGCCQRQNSIV